MRTEADIFLNLVARQDFGRQEEVDQYIVAP
jgi:hypothetical protein